MGFNQFLDGLKRLGTGAMELHAMHLKSIGALCAQTLSYECCEFELVDEVSDDKIHHLYNQATEIWTDLHAQLADRCRKINEREEMAEKIAKWTSKMGEDGELSEELRHHLDLHRDSDSESESEDEDDAKKVEERKLQRTYHERQSKSLLGEFCFLMLQNNASFATHHYFSFQRAILVGSSEILQKSMHRLQS